MKKKKSNNWIFKNYISSLDFIKESKFFIYWIILMFLLFAFVGFFIPAPEAVSNQILKFIEALLAETQNLSQYELTNFIFFNNLQSSFFGMILGVLFGIFPMVTTIINGYVLGFVASASVDTAGFSVLWKLVPHGIFELPAIFISLGLGLKISTFILERKKLEAFKIYSRKSLITFLLIILPLLVIAAVIEGALIFLF